MVKRLLDIQAEDLRGLSAKEKLESIKKSEGRVLVSETIGKYTPMLGDISNAELATAFGADIILVNLYDCDENKIQGIDSDKPLKKIKELTNRLVGVNLEPVYEDNDNDDKDNIWRMTPGRRSTIENVQKLIDQDVDILVLTGNPDTGVTNEGIYEAIRNIKNHFGDKIIIISGKMHSAGSISESGSELMDENIVKNFIDAGTDIILLPAPGTVPGFDLEKSKNIIQFIHKYGKMSLTAIGTSQEGADTNTIRQIALNSKMAGTDMHHIGDSGISPGIATPENIMAYSIAIKGKRHTYRRMSKRGY